MKWECQNCKHSEEVELINETSAVKCKKHGTYMAADDEMSCYEEDDEDADKKENNPE